MYIKIFFYFKNKKERIICQKWILSLTRFQKTNLQNKIHHLLLYYKIVLSLTDMKLSR